MTRTRVGDEILFKCDYNGCGIDVTTNYKVGIPDGWQQIHGSRGTEHSCPEHAWNPAGGW